MKHPIRFWLAAAAIVMTAAQPLAAQAPLSNLEYLQLVGGLMQQSAEASFQYNARAVHSRSASRVEAARQALLQQLAGAEAIVERTPHTDAQAPLQLAYLENLRTKRNLLQDQWRELAQLRAVAEQSYAAMQSYYDGLNAVDAMEDTLQSRLELAFERFAAVSYIQLVNDDSKFSQLMRRMGAVNQHVRGVNLATFRTQYLMGLLLDDLQQQRTADLDSSLARLQRGTRESLADLRAVPTAGDESYRSAAQRYVLFVDGLARQQWAQQVALMKKGLNNNPDIAAYNRIIGYVNQHLNPQAAQLAKAEEAFLERNVPRRAPKR